METSLENLLASTNKLNKEERELIKKAYQFSQKAHQGQSRQSGEPYFVHPFATARNLAGLEMSGTTIAAGLLHDLVEDVGVLPETIEKEFGKEVRFIVDGVTKLGHLKYHGADRHNESLRKLFVAMSQDIRVLIVKLCDRVHNMETLKFIKKEKQLRIAQETLEIYASIAHRLGIMKLSRQLEDLSFPFVHPKEYQEIRLLVKQKREKETESLEKFRKSVTKKLAESGLKNFRTSYRIKGLYSIYKKYLRKDKDIDKIYDVAAMRIILQKEEDCYRVLGLIHDTWQPIPGKIKDYIAFPKQNGYRALHTTVFTRLGTVVEVQIKTEEMYKESEYGIASHIVYKSDLSTRAANLGLEWIMKILPSFITKDTGVPEKSQDTPKWIRELADYQQHKDHEQVMTDLKSDFLNERIFVFTPKGDVVDLPTGSTAVDFAYSIHSDIGDRMAGVKINSKMSSLDTILKSGDIVEIITKKTGKPNRKWLAFAKTALAKKHIKGPT